MNFYETAERLARVACSGISLNLYSCARRCQPSAVLESSDFQLGLSSLNCGAIQKLVEVCPCPFGLPQMEALGNLLDRQGGLSPQTGCQRQFRRMTFWSHRQVTLRPLQMRQSLPHDSLGLGLRSLKPRLTWMVFADFVLHLL